MFRLFHICQCFEPLDCQCFSSWQVLSTNILRSGMHLTGTICFRVKDLWLIVHMSTTMNASPWEGSVYCNACVCLCFVCLSVCPLAYPRNHAAELCHIFCACWLCLWLGSPLMSSSVIYFRFCGRRDVFIARCTIVRSCDRMSSFRLSVRLSIRPSVRLSVCPSVCDVGGSWPHWLKILETNCTIN